MEPLTVYLQRRSQATQDKPKLDLLRLHGVISDISTDLPDELYLSSSLDPIARECGQLKVKERQTENFEYWHDQLVILKQAFDEAEPRNIKQWWHDRRKKSTVVYFLGGGSCPWVDNYLRSDSVCRRHTSDKVHLQPKGVP